MNTPNSQSSNRENKGILVSPLVCTTNAVTNFRNDYHRLAMSLYCLHSNISAPSFEIMVNMRGIQLTLIFLASGNTSSFFQSQSHTSHKKLNLSKDTLLIRFLFTFLILRTSFHLPPALQKFCFLPEVPDFSP